MYELEFAEGVERTLRKLSKKNPWEMKMVIKKIELIQQDPYRFKPLKKPMANKRRVHTVSSMVLVYSINEKEKTVRIEDYDHHDKIYRK